MDLSHLSTKNKLAGPAIVSKKTHLDLSTIPDGFYAVPGSSSRLKIKIKHADPTGKWKGWIFVSDGAIYGSGKKYGSQKPGQKYQGDIANELAIILKDPKAACAAYGRLVGRCGLCGLPLENEESLRRGIGPVCASRVNW